MHERSAIQFTKTTTPACTSAPARLLQRACACGQHTGNGDECETCRKKRLQRAAISSSPVGDVPPIVYEVLRSPSQPLDSSTRAFMEPRIGHDFSRIPTYTPAVGVIQTKLAINQPGDEYEQEADRIAEQVLAASAHPAVSGAAPRIQRFTGQATGQANTAPASVDHILASPGRPLDPALRQDMEQHFGHDFSRVRVHSGAAAEQSAREVNAYAYTVGPNIVFGAGQLAPGTHQGRRLIAHELTHVVQQQGSIGPLLQRTSTYTNCNDEKSKLITSAINEAIPLAQNAQEVLQQVVMLSYEREALRNTFGSDVNTEQVAKHFENIAKKLNSKTFECKTSCPKTQDKKEACARGDNPGNKIEICPIFERESCGKPALTLIHEAAHNEGVHHGEGGPLDNAYHYENFAHAVYRGVGQPEGVTQ